MSCYHVTTTVGTMLGGGVSLLNLASPDTINLRFSKFASCSLVEVGYLVLLLDRSKYPTNLATRGQVWATVTQSSLLTSPTNFGINVTIYANSSFGGFDGNCIIGMTEASIGGYTSAFYKRSVIFDARSNPFDSVENVIHYNGAIPEYFFTRWNSVCVAPCPPGNYYVNTICYPCPTNCLICSGASNCTSCASGYSPTPNNSSCIDCLALTLTCTNCHNISYCTACVN